MGRLAKRYELKLKPQERLELQIIQSEINPKVLFGVSKGLNDSRFIELFSMAFSQGDSFKWNALTKMILDINCRKARKKVVKIFACCFWDYNAKSSGKSRRKYMLERIDQELFSPLEESFIRLAFYGYIGSRKVPTFNIGVINSWFEEYDVPRSTQDIDFNKSGFTILELTAISRELCEIQLPVTVGGMRKHIQRHNWEPLKEE